MNKLFALKPQRENETLFKYIYRSSLGLDIFLSILISFMTLLFTYDFNWRVPITFFCATTALTLFLALLAGSSFSRDLSELYLKFQLDPDIFSENDKIDILRRLCLYPSKVGKAVYTCWLLAGAASIVFLSFQFNMSSAAFLFFWAAICRFPSIAVYSVARQICCQLSSRLINENFKEKDFLAYMDGKKFFGESLNNMFFNYIFLPMVGVAVMICAFMSTLPKNYDSSTLVRLFVLLLICVFAFFATAFIFISTLRNENNVIADSITAFSKREKDDISSKDSAVVPVNYYTDFSYSGILINRISKQYQLILDEHESTRRRVSLASDSITGNLEIIENLLESQMSMLETIDAQLTETSHTTESVRDHIMENHKIAEQTKNHVEFGQESITQNLIKMNEITKANNTSVSDIKTLSREINTIWEIVNIINGIADRTKIIAFNAELEAESFESENSSFKNVAVNIRALADKIMELTKDIRSQIILLQASSHNLIIQGNDFSQRIREGNQLTVDLASTFNEIHESAQSTVSASGNISIILNHIISERKEILGKIKRTENALQNMKEASLKNKEFSEKIIRLTNYKELTNNGTSSLMPEEK